MMKTDVLVIGGSAAGIIAAITGKSNYPDKDFLLVRREQQVIIPCGIPYIFGSLESSEKDVIPDKVLSKAGIELKVSEVVSIDPQEKVCQTTDGTQIHYEKLVLATGSKPRLPRWLKGAGLENVFMIPKDKVYLDMILGKLQDFQKIVVVGGGFIGVEMSDELHKRGKDVTLVEILPHVLGLVFDEEIAAQADEILAARGVTLRTGVGIQEVLGDTQVSGVRLANGEELAADAVILAMGYAPNTKLAEESGIPLDKLGFIKVDEYMRTECPDIFAVGDCAEKRGFTTRKVSGVMLASTATSEARIAGMNLYDLGAVKTFSGTIAIFATAIGGTAFGAAGLTEAAAKKEGFDVVTGSFQGVDRHPGALAGMHKQLVKLIVAPRSGVILGGEVVGGSSTGELTNLIGLAIQNRMTVNSLFSMQLGTHPLLTAPPTAYPLIKAAEAVVKKIKPAICAISY